MRHPSVSTIGWAIVAGAAFCASSYCAIQSRFPSSSGLTATPRVCSFGNIKQNTVLHETIRLHNGGTMVLELDAPHPSCSCTIVRSTLGRIAPGETKELEIDWHVGYRRGRLHDSILVTYVYVASGQRGFITVPLEASVVPDIALDIEELTFSRATASQQRIMVLPSQNAAARIDRAIASNRSLSVEILDGNTVVVAFDPTTCADDVLEAAITLHLTNATTSTISVPVHFQ